MATTGSNGDLRSIKKAAEQADVSRNAIARWISQRKLKATLTIIESRAAKLVSLRQVKELAKHKGKPGRPCGSRKTAAV